MLPVITQHAMPPVITQPMRLDGLRVAPARFDDLPALLAPYATAAPIFAYLLPSGHILASRMRRSDAELDEEDLILVLMPHRRPAEKLEKLDFPALSG